KRHRVEVFEWIKGNTVEIRWVDNKVIGRDEYGMSVGCCLRRLARADVCVGTGDILNIELLSELLGESLGGEPRKNVGRAAGREGYDHTHRPRRIIERRCDARHGREHGSTCGQMQKMPSVGKFHVALPEVRFIIDGEDVLHVIKSGMTRCTI